ncbi:DUF1800 family protein [Puniceicoccus vermicola]|uniref:DUF1800 family protein n=1 Tax=Puniceicoccus vermicola TaxID=388746 RepID=A0A7X1AVT3_9BACT|nr:DUF1800 family protein [Puniceicoccus vermicola]
MPPTFEQIPTLAVWEPVHPDDWGPGEARHFLERAGFASTTDLVEEATDLAAEGCCERFFPETPLVIPEWIEKKIAEYDSLSEKARETKDREARRMVYRERNQLYREFIKDFEYEWLLRASHPDAAFRAKWELFLSDVWVVENRTVRDPSWISSYWITMAEKSDLPYPQFCKDFSREPAMVRYLDLHRSSKKKPNENFARELLELFTLGEGNYSEADIKQAARSFTGRRLPKGEYREVEKQRDNGTKTFFQKTGNWDGDDIIDIVFQQPAARTYLPSEAIRFYLTQDPISEERLRFLGDLWAEENFQLDALRRRLFSSRGFYAQDFRGTRIKSPIQFYLGNLQRLGLQPAPLPQRTTRPLRDMGQELFDPPNVRGWIGGAAWINAGKLAARRQTADALFDPLPMKRLNADDKQRVEREEARPGSRPFYLKPQQLTQLTGKSTEDVIRYIQDQLLATKPDPEYLGKIRDFLGENPKPERIRTVVLTVIQSPQYQLS